MPIQYRLFSGAAAVLALASTVCATPTPLKASPVARDILPRTTVASDAIVGFSQTVPSGEEGDIYTAYQPYLDVVNGCVPFPAVNAEGDTKCVIANRCLFMRTQD
jgi:hypothetical protein